MGFPYYECSAKTQQGLKAIFEQAMRTALNKKAKNGKEANTGRSKPSRKSAEEAQNKD